MDLADLVENSGVRSCAIVGTAKNVGKTVTMNYLSQELTDRGFTLGLISSGRDGETIDSFTGEPKPQVMPEKGAWVATAEGVLGEAATSLEIVDVLESMGLFGRIVIGRVVEPSPIELVGPQSQRELSALVKKLLAYGADLVLVDGALDRRAAASPKVTEGAILATGATSGESLLEIGKTIAGVVFSWSRPEIDDEEVRDLAKKAMGKGLVSFIEENEMGKGNEENVVMERSRENAQRKSRFSLRSTNYPTCLGFEEDILEILGQAKGVVVPGALGEKFLTLLSAWVEEDDFMAIAKDPTCIFSWQDPGLRLRVLESINLIGITVNPTAQKAVTYSAKEMVRQVSQAARAAAGRVIPVFDVVSGQKIIKGVAGMAMG